YLGGFAVTTGIGVDRLDAIGIDDPQVHAGPAQRVVGRQRQDDLVIAGDVDPRAETRPLLPVPSGHAAGIDAAGGDEAALFVHDLYVMYKKFAEKQHWKFEILEASPTELGGFKEIVLGLGGESIFRNLQYESGGHRVQRVPETESAAPSPGSSLLRVRPCCAPTSPPMTPTRSPAG
ncbi:MAG: PCRF domain-containing protein, partial [Proteobacteria bacterium]|nr:PCRF domain-containing protein [Pseudomonadota bacterium]